MHRMSRPVIFFIVGAVMAISVQQSVWACKVDDFFNTKEGALAASTQEALTAATGFQEDGNKEKLADLIKGGTVLRLTGDVKVQVMERSVVFKTLKIKIPDEKELYWVKDGSLKELPCN